MSETMKKFAIIEDKDGQKHVVPSLWITLDKKTLMWPPIIEPEKIKKLAASCTKPAKDWKAYSYTRFIKSKDNYIDAVQEIKQRLVDIPDTSDTEKLKASRSSRNKKRNYDYSPEDGLKDKKMERNSKKNPKKRSRSESTDKNKELDNSNDLFDNDDDEKSDSKDSER